MSTDTIPVRVARGVAVLDEKRPGWHERTTLPILDMRDCEDCVVGQEFFDDERDSWQNPYGFGIRELLGEESAASRYGFDAEPNETGFGYAAEFAALLAEWTRVIEARRSAA